MKTAAKRGRTARAGHGWARLLPGLCLLATLGLSCSGRLEATVRADLSARMAIRIEVPDALASRVRQIVGSSASTPLFDVPKLKSEFARRSSMFLVDLSSPSPESLTSVVWIPSLEAFIADKSLVPAGMLALSTLPASGKDPAMRELAMTLNRDNAASAYRLFPGVDRKVLDALSPPALDQDPLSAAEYRMNLETVIIGKKAMPSFDACYLDLTVTAPKTILSASGGTAQGQVFKARLPLFDLLTLEKPISLSLRWAD